MVVADHGMSVVVVAASADQVPPWLDHLVEETNSVVVTTKLTDLHGHLTWEMPDALILTSNTDEHLDCLQALYAEHDIYSAVVLCAEQAPDERFDDLIDFVIPPLSHPVFDHQIRQIILQKKRRMALEKKIAELQQNQASHRQAIADIEALKNAVVHNVSHELNTPLLQVKSAVALIAEDMKNNTLVDYATRATARLEAAVKNVTQLAASLNVKQMSPLLIGDIIDSALRELRRTWEHKAHLDRIQVTLDAHLPPALGDRYGISIVLQQLIDNALKYSEGKVEVSAHLHNKRIKITVRDYGIGIDPDEIPKIFDSFYKVDPKATRNFNGTGVGLANVRLILERHGTEVEVTSVKGKGSTFSFDLPKANLEK